MIRRAGCGLLLAAAGLASAPAHDGEDRPSGATTGTSGPTVLVFSRTTGFRHDSIPAGHALLQALATQHGFVAVASEDPAQFSAASLAGFDAVVFLNTTGTVLDAAQKQAFESWIRAGGGFVGVHAAADTEYQWPFYGELLGGDAWFLSHPAIQDAELDVEAGDDRATRHLPARFGFRDEWYNFQANPRPAVTVLLRIDEGSYAPGGGAMGADHPITWRRGVDAGRSWYTALGHRIETYADPRFRRLLLGGLVWASGDGLLSTGFESDLPADRGSR
ncbi:MAG: ThuA domain-containing protein [Xanthomonadales bacterium]|nr:ThuA domain-containing protein [Xanthomonadales bacterium]